MINTNLSYFRARYFNRYYFWQRIPAAARDLGDRIVRQRSDYVAPLSRKRWRELLAEQEARRIAALEAVELEAQRQLALKQAADAEAKAALRAKWAQEDAIAAAGAW